MAKEIERKFLLRDDSWKSLINEVLTIQQGYIISDSEKSIRVRITNEQAFLTIKSGTDASGFGRSEFEYEIPMTDAKEIFTTLCIPGKIEKTRYEIPFKEHIWEIDVFSGDNQGLITAEIELSSENELFELPDWIGDEVTFDKRYSNGVLAREPYKNWK